jgi:xanthine/uracil/vitamin C permease (AzgA family)
MLKLTTFLAISYITYYNSRIINKIITNSGIKHVIRVSVKLKFTGKLVNVKHET